jgi:hypothetical protein
MHFLLKGIVGRMIALTFGSDHTSEPYNLHHPSNRKALAAARQCILWTAPPDGHEWPRAIFDSPAQLKCAEILAFVRIFAIPALADLPRTAWLVWATVSRLVSKLLFEQDIPNDWISSGEAGDEVHSFIQQFEVCYTFSPGGFALF